MRRFDLPYLRQLPIKDDQWTLLGPRQLLALDVPQEDLKRIPYSSVSLSSLGIGFPALRNSGVTTFVQNAAPPWLIRKRM
jgi:hypothetical protein